MKKIDDFINSLDLKSTLMTRDEIKEVKGGNRYASQEDCYADPSCQAGPGPNGGETWYGIPQYPNGGDKCVYVGDDEWACRDWDS